MRLAGGLGNTMFQYATYIQLRKLFPNEDVYICSIWFDFTGYPNELCDIFKIDLNSIDYYNKIIQKNTSVFQTELNNLRYWKKISNCDSWLSSGNLSKYSSGLSYIELPELLLNYSTDFTIIQDLNTYRMSEWIESVQEPYRRTYYSTTRMRIIAESLFPDTSNMINIFIRCLCNKYKRKKMLYDILHGRKPDYCGAAGISRLKKEGNVYYNIYGNYNDCNNIREELLAVFKFPELVDIRNCTYAESIHNNESIFIHARVKNFDYGMKDILKRNYYVKAVNYIKKMINKPLVFFVFSDDLAWCKENLALLGLSINDTVFFIEGNTGKNSYKDMQLMSLCKHGIIPNSTFSWWGAYLIQNPKKVVITPYATLPGTISY